MSGKMYTDEELAYIAAFYEYDGPDMMAAAVGRSYESVQQIVFRMRRNATYERYNQMWREKDVNALERG